MTENNESIVRPVAPQVTEEMKKAATFTLNGMPFCPYDHFLKIKGQDGKERDYLPYAGRIAWFRAAYKQGTIRTEIIEHDLENGFILIKAFADNGEGVTAESYGSCTRASFQRGYVEKAETKAKNRALADLGLGTLAAQELEDDLDDVSDTPQVPSKPRPAPAPSTPQPAASEDQEAKARQARLVKETEALKIARRDGKGYVSFVDVVAKALDIKPEEATAAVKRGLTIDESEAVNETLKPYHAAKKQNSAA